MAKAIDLNEYPSHFPERFWSKVDQSGGCWEWTRAKDRDGYGQTGVGLGTRMVKAHRRATWVRLMGLLVVLSAPLVAASLGST